MFKDTNTRESKVSRDIRIMAEVEKIWIMYDLDNNGTLEFDEIQQYLQQMAFPHLTLSNE